MVTLSALIELLHAAIKEGRIETKARKELQAELATLQAQAASPKPKWAPDKSDSRSRKTRPGRTCGQGTSILGDAFMLALTLFEGGWLIKEQFILNDHVIIKHLYALFFLQGKSKYYMILRCCPRRYWLIKKEHLSGNAHEFPEK